jgi:hypothetical protein
VLAPVGVEREDHVLEAERGPDGHRAGLCRMGRNPSMPRGAGKPEWLFVMCY